MICGPVPPHGPGPNAFHVPMLGTSTHLALSIVLAPEVQKGQMACLSEKNLKKQVWHLSL